MFLLHMLATFAAFVISFSVAAKLLDGMKVNGGVGAHIVAATMYGLITTFTAWIIVLVLTFLTGGLALLVAPLAYLIANAILLIITSKLTTKLTVKGFGTALKASLLMSVFGWVVGYLVDLLF